MDEFDIQDFLMNLFDKHGPDIQLPNKPKTQYSYSTVGKRLYITLEETDEEFECIIAKVRR